MRAPDESGRLLELLREAGDEAVTLDELKVVGLSDPARALLELELAGISVQRVYEDPARGRRVTCVRLAADEPTPAPVPAAPVAATVLPAPGARPSRRPLALGALGLLLVALAVAGARRR
jgi:hypothetical protein